MLVTLVKKLVRLTQGTGLVLVACVVYIAHQSAVHVFSHGLVSDRSSLFALFLQLELMHLQGNRLTGPLPDAWSSLGKVNAFPP